MSYAAAVRKLPQDLQMPMLEFAEAIRESMRAELAVRREDINAVWKAIRDLAEAQKRSEQRLDRLEMVVHELAEAQKRTEQRLEELAEAQKRTEQRLDRLEMVVLELAEAQKRTEATVEKLVIRVGKNTGKLLEMEYRDKAFAYFGSLLRKTRVVPLQDLEADLEQRLTEAEMQYLVPLDLLVRGQLRRADEALELYLAVEVSSVIDANDVERARRRAGLLNKAGYRTLPVVAGEEVTDGGERAARESAVLLVQDGMKRNWEQALAALP